MLHSFCGQTQFSDFRASLLWQPDLHLLWKNYALLICILILNLWVLLVFFDKFVSLDCNIPLNPVFMQLPSFLLYLLQRESERKMVDVAAIDPLKQIAHLLLSLTTFRTEWRLPKRRDERVLKGSNFGEHNNSRWWKCDLLLDHFVN